MLQILPGMRLIAEASLESAIFTNINIHSNIANSDSDAEKCWCVALGAVGGRRGVGPESSMVVGGKWFCSRGAMMAPSIHNNYNCYNFQV